MQGATHDEAGRLAAWVDFLHAIERVWNKACAHFKRSPKWSNWHHQYDQARRSDELLAYLIKARGREEHDVSPVAWTMPPYSSADRADGGLFTLESVRFSEVGIPTFNVPVNINHQVAEVMPVPIDVRGRRYPPPTSHLGRRLPPGDLAIADAGLAYYRAFLLAAEEKFVAAG